MSSFTDTAIVLKRFNLAEADKIITLLTKYNGKLSAVAKGIRKPTSRKGGNLDLFNLVEVKIVAGRQLGLITEANALQTFETLKKDLDKIKQAYYLAELIDNFVPEEKKAADYFYLCLKTLKEISKSANIEETMKNFEITLLKISGFWADDMFKDKKPQTLADLRRFNRIFIEEILGKPLRSAHFISNQKLN